MSFWFYVSGPLLLLTNYLFMDVNPEEDQRSHLLTKFTSLALGLKNRPVLHCLGMFSNKISIITIFDHKHFGHKFDHTMLCSLPKKL